MIKGVVSTGAELAALSKDKTELLKLLLEEKSRKTGTIGRCPRTVGAQSGKAPTSWAQQRLWFIDQLEGVTSAYNTGLAVRMRGTLDRRAVRMALDALVDRHETLRTTFVTEGGEPCQEIAHRAQFDLKEIDLRSYDSADRDDQIRFHMIQESQGKFDIRVGPLIRGRLLQVQDAEHVLVVMMHHIISDGWSKAVLIREFTELYKSYSGGRDNPLKPLPIQYADYAHWQREWLQGEVLDRQLDYWRRRLDGTPPELQLPMDRPRPAVQSYRGESLAVCLNAELSTKLKSLAQQHEMTLFMVLCAAWVTLLHRLSGQEDVVTGTPVANRQRPELEGLIGFFVNTLALRVAMRGDLTVEELLGLVKETTLGAYDHQDVPFERIVEELQPERSLSRHPLFQVMFVLQNAPKGALQLPGLDVTFEEKVYESSKFDLLLSLSEKGEEIAGDIEYATDLLDRRTVERWMSCFTVLLEAMTRDVSCRIGELPVLTEEERHRVTASFNATTTPYSRDKLIHELFEEQVARTPHVIAVKHAERHLTYEQLNAEANRLARYLREQGVGPNQLVGICVERSVEMVIGLLGILKAGGAYVPLDPNYPADRLQYMLEDATPRVVLTTEKLWDTLPAASAAVVALDALLAQMPTHAMANLPAASLGSSSQDLVYVIYTSGTTGKPKGTAMPHRAMVNLMDWHRQQLPLDRGQRVLQFAALSFDVAFQEIFSTICLGGTLVLLDEWVRKDARALIDLLRAESIERLFVPPLMLQSVADCFKNTKTPPRNLRDVITAGEQLRNSPEIVALFKHLDGCRLHNHYGPTETHVVTALTLSGNPETWPTLPTIGQPINNSQIYILDANRQPVPTGVIGEIYIAGANVARGYLNRPELTEERFVRDPYQAGRARMYRTGDLGRWLPDGAIEYLGRNDDQVKIRGFRIELGEIEARLALHERVREAAVVAREDVPGGKRLVAYVTPSGRGEPGVEELREYLASVLPEHMIPSAFVVLESLPLTPSGKLNRRALPAPGVTAFACQRYEAPQGELEEIVARIWRDVLRVDRVGRHDNFFALGGHSLLLVQVMERLRQVGVSVDVRSMYESRTLTALARALTSSRAQSLEVPPNLIPPDCREIDPSMLTLVQLDAAQIQHIAQSVPGGAQNIQDIYPLAPLQAGMLFHHLLDEQGGDTYVVAMLFSLPSRRRLDDFIEALQLSIDRHDILRTAVLWEHLPQAVQVVYRRVALPIEELTLDFEGDVLEQMKEYLKPEHQRMDIRQAPLVRLRIAADSREGQWHAILQLHHLACDHESLDTMLAEVAACLRGRAGDLPAPSPYRDHVAQSLAHASSQDAEALFRGKLGDIEEPTAPFGLLNVHGNAGRIDRLDLALDFALAQHVRDHARRLGVSAATLFHAAWALVVAHTSGRNDVVFGTVLLGRLQGSAGARRVLGLFMNTLPLRLRLDEVAAVELVERTQRELIDLLSYEQTSLAVAQRCSGIAGSVPLFSSLLNYRWGTVDVRSEFANAGVTRHGIRSSTNYPLSMSVLDQGEGFLLHLQTDRSLDVHRVMRYMCTAVRSLVDALDQAPDRPALSLSIVPEEERRLIVDRFNSTRVSYPDEKLIPQSVEEHAARSPHAIAVLCGDRQLTYEQLNERANELAHVLIRMGVRPDERVGVHVDRSPELIVALLAILKAGAAYVPLDTNHPTERLAFLLSDAAPVVVLTLDRLKSALPETEARIFSMDSDFASGNESRDNPDVRHLGVTPRNLAYVIYTSGSTGTPKGVMVEHRGLTNLARWHCAAFDVRAGSRCSCVAALGFDATVWEIWPPLSVGASVVLPSSEATSDTESLLNWWKNEPLDISFLPTPVAELAFSRDDRNETLRTLLVGGDRLRYRPLGQSFALVNNYGPTEATVVATSGRISDQDDALHIGRPIANAQIYILDSRRQVVPIGVTGEIYVAGTGIARGYLNRPELTAERFLPDPFSADPQARMYRTGDLGSWRPDGTIEYVGRNDQQVKIRGIRIELGEIEAHLTRHADVNDAVVIVREDVPGEKRLVGYVVPRDPSAMAQGADTLRAYLRGSLPEYMVPGGFVMLDRLPLTANGKLDRRALPAPDGDAFGRKVYEAPRGRVEEVLASIWEESLAVKRVGREDNFFELGGHSLLVLKVLFKINQHFDAVLKVTDVYKNPTIRELAARIGGYAVDDDHVELAREAVVDADIVAKPGRSPATPEAVLLTGATGFVGRFLLAQLLRDTDATVHCLVRAQTQHQAWLRLRATLMSWDLWRDDFASRIVAVPGDLRLPSLGIDEVTYRHLSGSIDSIFHCATSMNHLETYAMARAANVEASKEVLKLATKQKPKLTNFISTLGIFNASSNGTTRVVRETSAIEHERHSIASGYSASKWVGEKIFMTASDRGIPVNIFRLGLVWADSEQGRYDELQREYRLLKSCLLAGCGIENYRYRMPPTPVDFVARAIVYLGNRHLEGRRIFHISSPGQSLDGVFECCNEVAGTSLDLLPYYEWIAEMKRLHFGGRSLPVIPLIEYAFSMDEESFDRLQRARAARSIRYDNTQTRQELESAAIVAPVVDDDLLRRCVESMLTRDAELRDSTACGGSLVFARREMGLRVDG